MTVGGWYVAGLLDSLPAVWQSKTCHLSRPAPILVFDCRQTRGSMTQRRRTSASLHKCAQPALRHGAHCLPSVSFIVIIPA